MKKHLKLLFIICLALPFLLQAQGSEAITIPEIKSHVNYLASDELAGRKPGTEGGHLAAEYIRDQLREIGLELLGEEGFQYFDVVTDVETGENNQFRFDGVSGTLGADFSPLSFSENGTHEAEVVFAGYGFDIETDSLKWDDYADIEVDDRFVMILRGDPDIDSDSSLFIPYTPLRKKVLTAKDHGAAGVIFVSGPKFDKDDELIGVSLDQARAAAGIQVVHIKRTLADSLLQGSGHTIADLENKLIESMQPLSFDLGRKAAITTEIIKKEVQTQNVVGYLEGSDPLIKNEYIVLGAHFDHLGFGGPGSGSRRPDTTAIHNGANDNASGVAAVLEIIEKIAANPFKRSILFIAFGAEEMGLLGAKHFTANPLVDLDKIKFMFNLDMIGGMDADSSVITIGGTGTADGLSDLIDAQAENTGLRVEQSTAGYGPSDHAAFYMKNIPVLFFFTGAEDYYHTPADDPENLNYRGIEMIAGYAFDLLTDIANRPVAMVYQEAGPKERDTGRMGMKVTLGIMPDFAGVIKNGLRVDAVIPDRPAHCAGMKKGDVIVAIEGKTVNNIYDYMGRLSEFKKGRRISVDVMRDGKKEVLIVEL